MDRNRLTGRLIPIVLLVVSGATPAAGVFPEQPPAGVAQPALQLAHQASIERLDAMVGQRPEKPATSVGLTSEDRERIAKLNESAASGKPLIAGAVKSMEIGIDLRPVDVSAMSDQTYGFQDGTVRRVDGRLNWVIGIDAPESAGLRLRLDDVNLPNDASIYIHNGAGEVHGPYQGNRTSFWTNTITGNRIYVQVDVAEAASDDVRFRIGAALLFDPRSKAFCPTNAPCIEDGSCHTAAEWSEIDKVRKAIAHINFIDDGWSYVCSGGLLADTDPNTTIPYFLTANHCISDPKTAATVETWFNYQTPHCNAACLPIQPGTHSTLGATLLQNSAVDDHSLMVLDEAPPAEAWYLGWSNTPIADTDGTILFRLSHPQGSPQAYSAHRIDRSVNPADYCGTLTLPRGAYIFSRNVMGSTEGGSSGAPVLTAAGQVVGQLFGVCGYSIDDVCDASSNSTVDGAFANYYKDVAPWLSPDPLQLPVTVQKFGTGDGRVVSSLETDLSAASQSAGAVNPMLLGGTPVAQTEWPWQAALEVTTWRINDKWKCGGSVIHPNWILTAAHCVIDAIDERYTTVSPSSIKVRTGSTRFEYGGQESKVKRIVKHPEFDPISGDHDIALLELKSPVFADPIRPVTWEYEPSLACPGTSGSITGWTTTELCGNPAVVLSKVNAAIVDPDRCRSTEDATITSNMICSTSTAGNDDVQLDNGSPLVVGNGRGGYVQAGIVSCGTANQRCESATSPTTHTRLASHVEWMESVTGKDFTSAVGPNVIDCGSTCRGQFAKDSLVTLTAIASPGSTFGGWEGACDSTEDTCELTVTQALNVKAVFNSARLSALSCSGGTR
ncbi:serine protease [Thiocystis violacea]|uniref:serine protease n=1 Tax=Thiocystis violacea TaxID=13725 RepID=UPI0019067B67|nr:serine protease [Thiocystis violacea]